MAIVIEPVTMFLALVVSTIAAMLVLLWCYWLNRGEKSLLWTAVGFLFAAVATFLMAGRNVLPEVVTACVGGAILLLGVSFLWVAARSFNGKPFQLWMPLAGPVVWLAACAVPAFYQNPDVRVIGLSLLSAAYYLAAARAFAVPDGLLTRLPMTIVLVVHGMFVLFRIPLILTDDVHGILVGTAGWFGFATLEAVVFIQLSAFLMVSLTKERVERRLRDVAHTDQLTGLGNRRAFFERAEAAIAQAQRNGAALAVVVFDLDRFKEINDRHGHPVGDVVIQTFAQAASRRLRAGDFVARVGGEEFAALLPDTDGDRAALVALQVNQAFEAAVAEIGRAELRGTSSAGVAHLVAGLTSLDGLLMAADRALYEAKDIGRGQVRRSMPAPKAAPVRAA